jgi:hypothetical protein
MEMAMAGDPCRLCDRVECPWAPYEEMDYIDYDAAVAEDPQKEWTARNNCRAHEIDWRAEALALRSKLATAERERDEARRKLESCERSYENMLEAYAHERDRVRDERDTALAALSVSREEVEAVSVALDKALCICGAQPDTVALFGLWKAVTVLAARVDAFRSRTKEKQP